MTRIVLVGLLLPSLALATPGSLSHQGRLLDSAGAAITGSHDVTVALYDVPSGGTAVWTETLTGVAFDDGYFSVVIGESDSPHDALDGDEFYVGIALDTGAELVPRQVLTAVPFALHARTATSVDGGVVNASEIQINGTKVLDAGGLSSPVSWNDLTDIPPDIADGDDDTDTDTNTDTLAELSCSEGDVAALVGGSWTCRAPGALGLSAADVGAVAAGGSVTGTDAAFSGDVTLGASGNDTCDGSRAGTLRFTGGELQLCDGSEWLSVRATGRSDGSSSADAGRNCKEIHSEFPSLGDGTYWIDVDGDGGSSPFQVYCDMTSHGGGWTLVLSAGLGFNLTPTSTRVAIGTAPDSPNQPSNNTAHKFSDDLINQIRSETGDRIGYWVTTPGDGDGLKGAEIFHRADCVFRMSQVYTEVKASTCHQSTISYSESPSWADGGHWWDGSSDPSYRWAFGYANEGDHGTGQTCYTNGTGLGAHTPNYAPFHRGWCASVAWGQVWVR